MQDKMINKIEDIQPLQGAFKKPCRGQETLSAQSGPSGGPDG